MRAYPEYKASGIEWLPEVPENWDIWKMKFLTRIETGNKNTEDAEENGEYPFYVRSDKVERISTYSFEGEAILTAGDGVGVAKVFHYANGKMAIHQRVYKISHFKKVLGEFLYYYIRENFEKEVIKLSAKTTVDSLRMPMLANFLVAYPSKQEQQAIVNFLDYKTRLIDNFIANRQQQQKLLKEQKAGIINKAVTKGINPHANMKPSGIEWLPEIPVTWDVWKMKFLSRIETGNKNTEDAEENGIYPFYVRSDKVEKISSYSFEGEAILTAGDGVGVAKVYHYANSKMAIHQRVYKISHFKRVLGEFLYFYIKDNFEKEVIKLSAKTTVDSLRMPMLANFPVAHPDKDEQELILEYIKKESEKIDTLITKYQKQIELMQEYRTALISQAVTGKIDVRHWQLKNN